MLHASTISELALATGLPSLQKPGLERVGSLGGKTILTGRLSFTGLEAPQEEATQASQDYPLCC